MRSPEELTESFRQQGLKVTPQRQAVFRAIHGDHSHPTAESVHKMVAADMPTVSLRTVYQTLNDLTDMGEIRSVDLGTGSTRFDPNVESIHQHFVCTSCGQIRDLAITVDTVRPKDLPAGFKADNTELLVRGKCDGCNH